MGYFLKKAVENKVDKHNTHTFLNCFTFVWMCLDLKILCVGIFNRRKSATQDTTWAIRLQLNSAILIGCKCARDQGEKHQSDVDGVSQTATLNHYTLTSLLPHSFRHANEKVYPKKIWKMSDSEVLLCCNYFRPLRQ